MLILIFSMAIVGCSSEKIDKIPEQISDNEEVVNSNNEQGINNEVEVEENNAEIPIYPDDIMADITILEPNSIGTVYMEATYINNSEYPITSYSAKILLKDKNETTYLSTHDTVLPGETSPKFKCFGPETGKNEDYEILTLDVRARLDNGKTLSIEYDFKLEEARWSEYDN